MEKYIYSQHDKFAKFYNPIMTSEIEPKAFAENVRRSIIMCKDPAKIAPIEHCELVFLGTFDDETGKFDIGAETKLLDCDTIIKRIYGTKSKSK